LKKVENMAEKKKKTLVMKFGGTSVGSAEAIRRAAGIIGNHFAEWNKLVVVVSAMAGVTDMLISCAQEAASGNEKAFRKIAERIEEKHRSVYESEISNEGLHEQTSSRMDELLNILGELCTSICVLGEVSARGLDAIGSLGERMNAILFSAVLREKGLPGWPVEATNLIVTDNSFNHARPFMNETCEKTKKALAPLFDEGMVPIVTGFIAATRDGITTTLGRGGSDYTASILGTCLDADEVWTWTDVDGVMTADPRIVPDARVIPEITYREVSEMAYFGAKVLHPKAIRPVIENGIPLWVKNTFHPECPGTRIDNQPSSRAGLVTAVTLIRGLSLVTVEGSGMLGVPGIAARTFSAVAREQASVLMISQSSSEQSICFVIPSDRVSAVTSALEEEMAFEISRRDIDRVWSQDTVAIVSAIGAGMRHTPGVSARIFGALGRKDINVIAIAQGSSEFSISVVVDEKDADDAVRQIHREVILNELSNQ